MSNKPSASRHDEAYKRLFSHPRMVRDLLRGFVPAGELEGVDWTHLERLPASQVTADLRARHGDMVWAAGHPGAQPQRLVLLEFQSTVDPAMLARLITYGGLLYEALFRTEGTAPTPRVPAILSIVLYNGKPRWTAVQDLVQVIDHPAPRGAPGPLLRYVLVDVHRYAEDDLERLTGNLVAALARLERARTPSQAGRVVGELDALLRAEEEAALRQDFKVWLNQVLFPAAAPQGDASRLYDFEEVTSMLEQHVDEWIGEQVREAWRQGHEAGHGEGREEGRKQGHEQGRKEGRKQGRKEGREEGERRLLVRQLERKFDAVPQGVRERIAGASAEELEAWAERVLEAETLEEVCR